MATSQLAHAGSSMNPPSTTLSDVNLLPPPSSTEWRRRRRRQDRDTHETGDTGTDDDARSVVSSQWQPDAADVEMMHSLSLVEALPVGRMQVGGGGKRRVKRMKVVDLGGMGGGLGLGGGGGGGGGGSSSGAADGSVVSALGLGEGLSGGGLGGGGGLLGGLGGGGLGGSGSSSTHDVSGGMFTDIQLLAPADEHTGNALLCFLATDTFVGFVELEHEGERHVLKLTGSESLTECDRALCAVQDCCGDKAFLVTAQTCISNGAPLARQPQHVQAARRKRTYLARSSGVGDYVAFEGRGMRFLTDFVPGDEQREQVHRARTHAHTQTHTHTHTHTEREREREERTANSLSCASERVWSCQLLGWPALACARLPPIARRLLLLPAPIALTPLLLLLRLST